MITCFPKPEFFNFWRPQILQNRFREINRSGIDSWRHRFHVKELKIIVVVICCVGAKDTPVGQHISNNTWVLLNSRNRFSPHNPFKKTCSECSPGIENLESKANILYHKVRHFCSSTSTKLYFHEFHLRPLNPAGCYLAFGLMFSEKSSPATWIWPARHSLWPPWVLFSAGKGAEKLK